MMRLPTRRTVALPGMFLSFGLLVMTAGQLALVHSAAAQTVQNDEKVEPPRPVPGDVMRHWPAYPDDARAAGQEGTVVVQLRVTASGAPEDIVVLNSSSVVSLDVAAVAAVSRWRFEPGKRGGVAQDMTVSLPIRFSLPDEEQQQPNSKQP
ncbi:TonB family protein [Pseudochelatococcus contaminans]|uniref:TonB family protein n=2 Tax=Pseudochelatococcus contaminans TaxID=1538103 RepID=A0A7W6EF22_9HYPH|nr:TonB family protein [Pseudochelatococcus contaminans]